MSRKLQILILILVSYQVVTAQETFKTMFYNVLNFPDQLPATRIDDLEVVLNNYQPDIFAICELNNETGANTILSTLQNINPNFQRASFQLNTSDNSIGNQNDLQNMIYFDSLKFSLELFSGGLDQAIVTTLFRDFNHYRLKLNTVDQNTNPIFLNVIVCHLKASSGSDNELLRLSMVEDLKDYLDTLSSNEYVMLMGDLNVYRSSEAAFQLLISSSNNIPFVDPANRIGSWHNNDDFIDVFTQSTRTQSGIGGSTGGFDDRFDFILTSENMQTSTEMSYVTGTYQVFGNNGLTNCYNQAINSSACGGASDEFSQSIRNTLHNFSDHLPVTLEIQTDETLNTETFTANIDAIKFVGTNIISNSIKLKVNNQSLNINQLNIYNSLGQLVKTISLKNSIYINKDISNLSRGIYYIATPSLNFEPLKFIKVD